MQTREEALAYGLSFPDTYQEAPFHDDNWQLVRVKGSKKAFLWTYERNGYINLNVKVDPEWRDFWRSAFSSVIPGWHQNKEHWNTVILDGTIPDEDVKRMISESYDLVMDSPSKRIYEAVKKIPKGRVATYGQVAELAGDKKMARAVGNALHRNPDPDGIPCYRVVNAKGELAGEFAFGGPGAQASLLEADGIEVVDGKVDLEKYGISMVWKKSVEIEHFDLLQICNSGQCFRMKQLDEHRFSVIAGNRYVELGQDGSRVVFDCSNEEFTEFWARYFDLDADYQIYMDAVNPRDSYLCDAVRIGDGIRILRQDLWEMIVSFLISQQNNIVRIRRCIENICQRYGEEIIAQNGIRYYAFPTPEQLAKAQEEELRDCNLGYRAKYVLRAAQAVSEGSIDLKVIQAMEYKKAKEELLRIYGVGEKVADCICLFALHHLDAFPVDTHIRQALDAHYKRGFPNRRYKGMRGVIQQYIFYYELFG